MTRLKTMIAPLLALTFGVSVTVLFLRNAYADPATSQATMGTDWTFWIAIASAVGTAASYVLHALAARRHSTALETIASDIDAVRLMAKGAPETQLKLVKPPGAGAASLLAVLLLGTLAAPALTGCHTAAVQKVEGEGKAAASAVLDCEKQLAPGQLEQGLVLLAGDLASMVLAHGAIDWNALATAAIGDASNVRACALAEYHAVMLAAAPAPAAEAKLVQVNAPPVNALAAAVARIKAARHVTAIATPGGPV